MAAGSETYWQLEKVYYTIVPKHDLVVRVVEHGEVATTQGEGDARKTVTQRMPTKLHEYKVKREVLSASGNYFNILLIDPALDGLDLHEDNAASMTLWFKLLHSNAEDASMYEATIDDIWYMIAAGKRYDFKTTNDVVKAWFDKWYLTLAQSHHLDYKEHQALLLPTYVFDNAQAFCAATRYVVYRATTTVTERRPIPFLENEALALDPNIVSQLNAAKARIKTMLHRGLYNPIDDLLKRARCRCKPHALYAYEQSLSYTGAWPLETSALNNSMEMVLRKLEHNFPVQPYRPQTCGSQFCTFDFRTVVDHAGVEARNYFDGLCLDCMHHSVVRKVEDGAGEGDEEYWRHSKQGVPWDAGCRIQHSQPAWFFSFQGPRQKM
ncbi:hypothetical protein LTR62_004871 [Meristemomyces frigidus]|uniref:Uncharacterized protein n=1 Tax=Meristemomyces frigidus TaxID=1508187 RepID=A0AAN7YJN9_9PEZI|nr:hypothetical protein LTR62_004871 [Meristemomyces frigidus]